MQTKAKIPAPSLNPEYAPIVMNFVRQSFMRNFTSARIIGMNVRNLSANTGYIAEMSTLPGSTDLVVDLKLRLCEAVYDVSPALKMVLKGGSSGVSETLSVQGKGGVNVAVAKLVKRFDSSDALTYRDLSKYFMFYGVDMDTPLVHITDKQAEVEFAFYLQMVKGIQEERQNAINCAYIFGQDAVLVPMAANALQGFMIYPEIDKTSAALVLCATQGDSRLSRLQTDIANRLDAAVKAFDLPIEL